jgi:hypothetical protein
MVWEPFAIALVFGLATSGMLYFVLVWPGREPEEPDESAPSRDAGGE